MTGASDKTLRQWDLTTGQCVMTMDILWAISHPSSTTAPSPLQNQTFPGSFSVQMPPYADGTRECYEDFVGGVQFWGYGLVSGSGDGAVRMWDSKSTRFLKFQKLTYRQCALAKLIERYWDILVQ